MTPPTCADSIKEVVRQPPRMNPTLFSLLESAEVARIAQIGRVSETVARGWVVDLIEQFGPDARTTPEELAGMFMIPSETPHNPEPVMEVVRQLREAERFILDALARLGAVDDLLSDPVKKSPPGVI